MHTPEAQLIQSNESSVRKAKNPNNCRVKTLKTRETQKIRVGNSKTSACNVKESSERLKGKGGITKHMGK